MIRQVVRAGPFCHASPEITFRFGSAYQVNAGGLLESWLECELIDAAQMRDSRRVLSLLDDVLAIASFAERRILVLTGWSLSHSNGANITKYRRDFTPPFQEKVDIDSTLIAPQDVEEFLDCTFRTWGPAGIPGALKQAIYFALYGQNKDIGGPFVVMFAGIETLLNLFDSPAGADPIVPEAP